MLERPSSAIRRAAPYRGGTSTMARFPRPEPFVPAQTPDLRDEALPSLMTWRCPSQECNPGVFRMGLTAAERPSTESIFVLRRRNSGAPGATCPYCGTDAPDEAFLQPGYPEPAEDLLCETRCDVCRRPYGVYAASLFCPDCGAPNLHIHLQRETQVIGRRVGLAHQAQRAGNAASAMRTLAAAHEDAVIVLDACLMAVFRFLAKGRLPAEAADDAGDGFQDFARCRAFFGQLRIDPFARLSPQNLDCVQRHFEKRQGAGRLLKSPAAAFAPSRRTRDPEEVGPLSAAETLRLVHIASDVVGYLEGWYSDFERMAAAQPRPPMPAVHFAELPRTAPSPESRKFNELRASCDEAIAGLSQNSRAAEQIIQAIADKGAEPLPVPQPLPALQPLPTPQPLPAPQPLSVPQPLPAAKAEPAVEKPADLNLIRRAFARMRLWGHAAPAQEIPATITVGRGMLRRTVRGGITNCSETGAIITLEPGVQLAPGDAVKLRWRLPPREDGQRGRICDMKATVAERSDEDWDCYGVRFHRMIKEHLGESFGPLHKISVGTAGLIVIGAITYLKVMNLLYFWYTPMYKLYNLIAFGIVFVRIFTSFFFYEEPQDNGFLPKVTVGISAKNEEVDIIPTVEHVFASHYPKELLEVIVVDDGSTDNTWQKMQELAALHPGLKAIRFEKNRGKRHGMAEAAVRATGDILVFIDSDSFVEPEAIYRVVQPFQDETVGAVAGHTLVDVDPNNFISKMEHVRYYVSQRFFKASESIFSAVTCCPGAFSAYRRETVMKNLDSWLNQKFFGVQATFGDDRSLTNFILRTHRVIFHDGARVLTRIPSKWMNYFRQQLRWKKSWARETLVAVRFIWKEHPVAAIPYYASVVLAVISPLIIIHALIYMPLTTGIDPLQYIGGLILTYLFLGLAAFYMMRTPYILHGMAFAVLYIFVLSWQNYYAMLTVNKTKWGTR